MLLKDDHAHLHLIDDDPAMLRLLQTIIEVYFDDKIVVTCYLDPVEALQKFENDKCEVDIVLTDLAMPNVDGIEILKSVKNRNPFAQVLLLTGHSNHESMLQALEFGASDYLLKPVDKQSLLNLLDQAYQRRKRWQSALHDTWRKKQENTS